MSGFQFLAGRSARANYAQTKGSQVTINTGASFPVTIVSVNITTQGNPILVMVSGDANPLAAGGWGLLCIYRGTTAVGQAVQYESSSGNENVPYGIQVIDVPPGPGTYTYSLKVTTLSENTTFGEAAGPVISVVEL
jgi:hypothetical protein